MTYFKEFERQYREWMETMRRQPITEKTVAIRSRQVEWNYQSIVSQLVESVPKDVLLRTPFAEQQQLTSIQSAQGVSNELKLGVALRVEVVAVKEEYEPCSDCSSKDETLSGELTQEMDPDA